MGGGIFFDQEYIYIYYNVFLNRYWSSFRIPLAQILKMATKVEDMRRKELN